MANEKDRPFTMRLGVKCFEINDDEFLDPGALMDSLLDDEICKAGGFIARLTTWTESDGADNVTSVKDFMNNDSNFDAFHPEWLQRKTLLHRTLFDLNPVHDQTIKADNENESLRERGKLRRLQARMRDQINLYDFSADADDRGDLSMALKDNSLTDCLEIFLDNLEGKANDIVYLQNMEFPHPLRATAGASMDVMKTGLERLGSKPISGISKPTLYIGTEFSGFACHREDMSFCALNRHIAGAPKVWFCVPPRYYSSFIVMLQNLPIPEQDKNKVCLLLHKNIWVDPRTVAGCGIPVYPIIQRPGDIVFLLPNTIHWGFNVNHNINEAINFVCKNWTLSGMLSLQRCNCQIKWADRFEIVDVLKDQAAEACDIAAYTAGMTLKILSRQMAEQPLLYTNLRKMNDEPVHLDFCDSPPEALSSATVKERKKVMIKCTRCEYCPHRFWGDAIARIHAHAKRCHGSADAEIIMQEVNAKYGAQSRQYKCQSIICQICNRSIRGNMSNLRDHQNRKNCKKSKETDDRSPSGKKRKKQ